MKNLLPLGLALALSAPAVASDWTLDNEASSVRIETTAFGSTVSGEFSNFETEIRFDPENLPDARIVGRVMVESGDTGNPQYNSEMVSDDGLDADTFPLAVFVATDVTSFDACAEGDGECYLASGSITLRDSTQPADLAFRLSIEGDRAVARGELTLAREDFGIGAGNWASSAETVTVKLHIEAAR
ncbi:YceI family protein [Hyphobacterium sp.]|uniref:YceI family protein n=1 Tax=Hyphobacterium sp. TaxID=2004662 RepID=UPI003BAA7FF3